ncbi:MAG: hypothetical protein GTO02_18640 [Candidatus Dadabacteria bacterium]|nr:hypothetical protein [Candidatus Dadabacteria bacterium]
MKWLTLVIFISFIYGCEEKIPTPPSSPAPADSSPVTPDSSPVPLYQCKGEDKVYYGSEEMCNANCLKQCVLVSKDD